ncbi:hypothetical protein vBDshPR2C_49 [Dinoroseobacter phage vBDshPR2C]|uniref:Uncharacterized protein n=1 Tax=Dinoroseobacter phage vBDshPR2C TaxID=1498169 RepID=A0A0A7CHI2_9CAUD|nr:hypothetical protein vBDshPR2C_49 [Dinoroseobacter phage vBDshPR2C]
MSQSKSGIRWKIFKWFGPPEVQNLVNYIDSMQDIPNATGDIAIYPLGEFSFNVKTSLDDDIEPMIFPTPQERASFQLGLSYGVGLMGGTTNALSEDEFKALEEMNKKTTHGGGGSYNN